MRTLLTIMAIGAFTAGLFLALIYFWQSSLILLPGVGSSGADLLSQCRPGSSVWQEDGKYRGKVCEPAGAAIGTVVVYHGNAGTIDDRAYLATVFSGRGLRVVLPEYPGYGQREGKATINKVLAASLDDFEKARAKWPGPMYVLGESFGAGVAGEVTKKYGDSIDGVLLFTPWDSLANVVNAMFPIPVSFLLQQRFDTVEALSAYHGRKVIVAAGQDEVLPVAHARTLAKAVPSAAYLELPHAGHNDWPAHMTERDWDRITGSLTH
ncbi:hypothetical protein GCM10027343_16660 [Noviherbaspirillum agri]